MTFHRLLLFNFFTFSYLEGRYGAIPVFSTFDFARATSQTDVLAQTPDDCRDSAESISAPREEE